MQRILALMLLALSPLVLLAQGSVVIQGSPCQLDTVCHRHIAPGATYTAFQIDNIQSGFFTYKMRAHVIAIDLGNPYNTLSPYISGDKYYSIATQVQEVKRQKGLGLKPVASINGGLFAQGNSASVLNKNYEIVGGLVSSGEVKYESHKDASVYYISSDRVAHVENILLQATVSKGATSATVAQVNHYRNVLPTGITLFCNGMTKSQCSTESSAKGKDIKLKLLSGDRIMVGKNRCQVTTVYSGSKHSISDGEIILSSESGSGLAFLNSLSSGDIVEIDIAYRTSLGEKADVFQSMTNGFGFAIEEGKPIPSSFKNYAISALGTSKDGRTAYLADLEISPNSNAPVTCFAEMMAGIGIWNAIWLDGGPSAEMTVDGDFVTANSIGSSFSGRFIPSGFMLYSTAPDDNVVTSLELDNHKTRSLTVGQSFSFNLYAFNQYGEMISSEAYNLPEVSITCPEGLGTVEGNVFTATAFGAGNIVITLKGRAEKVVIPVTVSSNATLAVFPHSIFTGQDRAVQAELRLLSGSSSETLSPDLANWTASNKYVVSSCASGLITPFIDGYSKVYVEYQGMRDTIDVTVENLEDDVDRLDMGCTIASGGIHIPSVPRMVDIDVTGTVGTHVKVVYETGGGRMELTDYIPSSGKATLSILPDYDAPDAFPITILQVDGANVNAITAYYADDVDAITAHAEEALQVKVADGYALLFNTGRSAFQGNLTIASMDGRLIQRNTLHINPSQQTAIPLQAKGTFILSLTDAEGHRVLSRVML